jgi:hypothetical protein
MSESWGTQVNRVELLECPGELGKLSDMRPFEFYKPGRCA